MDKKSELMNNLDNLIEKLPENLPNEDIENFCLKFFDKTELDIKLKNDNNYILKKIKI
jgi:hypothetical protein